MELTRRDALLALSGGIGLTAVSGGAADLLDGSTSNGIDSTHIKQLQSIAAVIYPSEVDATHGFFETYVLGRIKERDDYQEGMRDALDALSDESYRHYRRPVTALTEFKLDQLLREIGVAMAYPIPNGTIPERIRYYVINDLLYALYTTPVGGRLVGYENPDGYPGGTEAYQRGPDS